MSITDRSICGDSFAANYNFHLYFIALIKVNITSGTIYTKRSLFSAFEQFVFSISVASHSYSMMTETVLISKLNMS